MSAEEVAAAFIGHFYAQVLLFSDNNINTFLIITNTYLIITLTNTSLMITLTNT